MDGRINAQEGRKQRQICGQKLRFRPTTINDFTVAIESQ
jgi:hypothetical protein